LSDRAFQVHPQQSKYPSDLILDLGFFVELLDINAFLDLSSQVNLGYTYKKNNAAKILVELYRQKQILV